MKAIFFIFFFQKNFFLSFDRKIETLNEINENLTHDYHYDYQIIDGLVAQ